MSAHTPGPWIAGTNLRGNAVVRWPDGEICANTGNGAQAEADACLIAAAPEMYALLADLALILEHGADFQLGAKGAHRDLVAQCRAVLAKARGR